MSLCKSFTHLHQTAGFSLGCTQQPMALAPWALGTSSSLPSYWHRMQGLGKWGLSIECHTQNWRVEEVDNSSQEQPGSQSLEERGGQHIPEPLPLPQMALQLDLVSIAPSAGASLPMLGSKGLRRGTRQFACIAQVCPMSPGSRQRGAGTATSPESAVLMGSPLSQQLECPALHQGRVGGTSLSHQGTEMSKIAQESVVHYDAKAIVSECLPRRQGGGLFWGVPWSHDWAA